MPDVTVLIRPDVTLNAVVPATVSHPYLHNVTNAVFAEAASADLGRVDVRVGFARNVSVTLGTETTVAGVGNTTLLRAGNAVGAGPSAGGSLTIQPGVGVGGGAAGEILIQTSGVLMNLRPVADGLVNLGAVVGGAQFQFNNVLTYSVQGRDGGLSINALRLTAGAGETVFVFGGDALGAGNAGGNLEIGPGTPGAGGAQGNIVLSTSGLGAYNVQPDTTNLVSLGSATVAFTTVFTRALRADDNQALAISTVAPGGTGTNITILAASGAAAGTAGAVAITAGNGAVGGALTFTSGNALSGGGNGGDIVWAPGSPDGAGTRGLIRITATTATNLQPDTTNVVTLGAATLAFAAVRTRILQADTGQNLVINEAGGAARLTVISGNTVQVNSSLRFLDEIPCQFGTSDDLRITWSTSDANNALQIATNVNSAAQSGNVILTTYANRNNEHGLAAVLTPRLAIFSAADMSVPANRTQYVQMYHDGTNGVVLSGSGTLGFAASGGTVRTLINTTGGGATFYTFTQIANTSGTPTGLLWTAGAHTGLAASVESLDWNVNLARTVQFATGALVMQRAFVIQAPTYGFVGASTLTTTATLVVTACPTAGTNATFTNPICAQFGGAVTIGATSAGLAYRVLDVPDHTVTVTGSTQVTSVAAAAALRLGVVTVTDGSAVTLDTAATLYIGGPPVAAGSAVLTTAWAILCASGAVGAGAGTVTRPGLSFGGDPNTGLYSQGADAIGFATNAQERLRMDSEAGANNTALLVSIAGGAVVRVSQGAAESGGPGLRALVIPN